ncbi:MAG: DNA-binding response regulator [Chitinophagaceae bacterium]|nr:DNA-binding response regulator [Chitinophagaceae bacterium]
MTRILLTDDHEILRAGLKLFIDDLVPHAVVDEAWDGDSALEKIMENEYQLIILDVNMPNTDSFALVNNIINIRPDAKILMFSMNAEEVYAKRYLQLGAKGYVSKTASATELGNAINVVLKNGRYISPALNEVFTEEVLGEKTNNPFDKLSSRELEIVQYLVSGNSVGAICNTVNLHSSTVGTYKARIFEKLGCKNVIEVNRLARIYNIIPQT